MNPSTALGMVLVDELVRGGVRDAVLCPGSRSAPLAFALHAADAEGRLRLHVRIDERTAGFLALGLAKGMRRPVPVVTTSGTAVANLHPAVLEADAARVPLVVLSADRPPELRGVGANQTIDQTTVFGAAVRLMHDVGAPDRHDGQVSYWRATVSRALAAASSGPVHINVPLREPLVPDESPDWVEPLAGRPQGAPWTTASRAPLGAQPRLVLPPRTLVVVGDAAASQVRDALDVARHFALPVIAEPTASRGAGTVLLSGPSLLGCADWLADHRPERLVIVGRPTLGREVARLVQQPGVDVTVIDPEPRWSDPTHQADEVRSVFGPPDIDNLEHRPDTDWSAAWAAADKTARATIDDVLDGEWPSGLRTARDLVAMLPEPALLMAGSSAAVRDLWLAAVPRPRVRIHANRGVSGIDGTISTAVGLALDRGDARAYALMGDLTFLHDANGLVIGPHEPRPDLTIVVNNDDGGGIFGQLEPGAPEHAGAFERVFGTPHGVDIAALCAATRTAHSLVATPGDLQAALEPRPGIRVVEVRTDRRERRELDRRVHTAVAQALAR